MNLTEVKKSLEWQFDCELSQGSKRSIVFWYDEEGVFADSIDTLALENVKLVKMYDNNNYLMHVADCQGIGSTPDLALCAFVTLCGAALRKPIQSQMCVLGNMSIRWHDQ